jgi:hypothetical protein
MSEVTEQQLEDMEALLVQTAASMTGGGGSLTLRPVAVDAVLRRPSPARDRAHVVWSVRRQLGRRGQQLRGQPPNAVLSFAEPGDRPPEDAVVVIQDPHLDADALTYSIKVLDGTVPAATGPCALLIDPLGRPLSPVSLAGMNRRARRRGR